MTPRRLLTFLTVALVGPLAACTPAAAVSPVTSTSPVDASSATATTQPGNAPGASTASATAGPITVTPSAPPMSPSTGQLPPRLSVSGDRVLDPTGHPIVLRGYSWGDWGTAQPQDAAANRAQGANSVRIPLRWWGDYKPGVDSRDTAAPGHIDPAHLAELDQDIRWATGQKLWVVLFLDSNYGQGAHGSTDNFWTDAARKQEFSEVWRFLAARYARTPYIGGFEILPEPHPPGVSDAAVKAFYDDLITVLRSVDTRTPLVVGPNVDYSLKHLDAAHTDVDRNIIYTGDYFIFGDPLDRMHDITDFEQRYHAPVWINQVGIPSGKPNSQTSARSVLGALNAAGVGWAWWTYRTLATSPDQHGIWYVDPNDASRWVLKPDWNALVGGYLQG